MRVRYELRYTLMNRNYIRSGLFMHLNVIDPATEVDFAASLSAEPAEINAGDTVRFRVTVRNTGERRINGFTIQSAGGHREATMAGLDPGDSRSVTINKEITEPGNVRFHVWGVWGAASTRTETKQTNAVELTVRAPTAAPTATPLPETASPSPAAPSETPAETTPEIATAQLPAATPTETAQAAGGAQTPAGVPYAALWIALAFVLALAILEAALLLRKRKAKKG